MENQKDYAELSKEFRNYQKSRYLDVPAVFRNLDSEKRLSLARSDAGSTETTTQTEWRDLLVSSADIKEESVYDNSKNPRNR